MVMYGYMIKLAKKNLQMKHEKGSVSRLPKHLQMIKINAFSSQRDKHIVILLFHYTFSDSFNDSLKGYNL